MSGENQKGFTIIETSLFLAISAMLFIGLFSGISLSVQRQRYSDSVQSTYSFLQKQFDETLNVVNSRSGDQTCTGAGVSQSGIGASDCIVIGKAIQFAKNQDSFKVFTIIGKDPNLPPGTTPTITDYAPRIIEDSNSQEYLIPWGAKIVDAKSRTTPMQDKNLILLLRSPENGVTSVYALNENPTPFNEELDNSYLSNANRVINSKKTALCLKSEDITNAFALLEFTGAGSQDGITVKFDAGNNCGL